MSEVKWSIGHVFAGNVFMSTPSHVEVTKNYNGSGESAFGGVSEWPVINLHTSYNADVPLEVVTEDSKLWVLCVAAMLKLRNTSAEVIAKNYEAVQPWIEAKSTFSTWRQKLTLIKAILRA